MPLNESEKMHSVLRWLGENWGWVLAVLGVFFEITPVKFSPVSALFRWFGGKLNAGVKEDIKALQKELKEDNERITARLDEQEKTLDLNRIGVIRSHILDFANSCRSQHGHSKDEFVNVLSENSEYELLVKKWDIRNDVYAEDYKYILSVYHRCLEDNSFLA